MGSILLDPRRLRLPSVPEAGTAVTVQCRISHESAWFSAGNDSAMLIWRRGPTRASSRDRVPAAPGAPRSAYGASSSLTLPSLTQASRRSDVCEAESSPLNRSVSLSRARQRVGEAIARSSSPAGCPLPVAEVAVGVPGDLACDAVTGSITTDESRQDASSAADRDRDRRAVDHDRTALHSVRRRQAPRARASDDQSTSAPASGSLAEDRDECRCLDDHSAAPCAVVRAGVEVLAEVARWHARHGCSRAISRMSLDRPGTPTAGPAPGAVPARRSRHGRRVSDSPVSRELANCSLRRPHS